MPLPALILLLALSALILPASAPANAQEDPASLANALAPRVLFVTSGGYWEESGDASAAGSPEAAGEETEEAATSEPSDLAEAAPASRGYYRLIATRGQDNRSQLHLQQIALTPDGPQLALSIGVDEINELGAYVTDIRPENSTGAASAPGFAAYIYLKTDPTVAEPETWALYIDEFGEIQVERSSN